LSPNPEIEAETSSSALEGAQQVIQRQLHAMRLMRRTTLDVEHHVLPRNEADPIWGAGEVQLGAVIGLFH
jgi:hypothetical protein